MNELKRAKLGAFAALLAALSGCGGKAVDLDHTTEQTEAPDDKTDATRVVNEPAKYIWSAGEHLLWTNFNTLSDSGKIRGCLKSHCSDSIIDYAQALPESVVVSPKSVVFGRFGIQACPVEGCGREPSVVYQTANWLHFALDDEYVYWDGGGDLTIYRCPVSGCQTPTTVASGHSPSDDHLVLTGDQIYWQEDGELRHTKADGTSSSPPAVEMQRSDIGQLTVGGDFAYFVDKQNRIRMCRVGQCFVDQPVLANTTTEKFQVQADALGVFWLEKDDTVHFCADTGCESGPIAVTPPRVYTFTIDEGFIYWSENVKDPAAGSFSPTMESDASAGNIHRTAR